MHYIFQDNDDLDQLAKSHNLSIFVVQRNMESSNKMILGWYIYKCHKFKHIVHPMTKKVNSGGLT